MKLLNSFKSKPSHTLSELVTSSEEKERIINQYGPLTELMADKNVSEIMINGLNAIYYEKRGQLHKSNISFKSKEQMNQFIIKMLIETDQHISRAHPILNGQLKDGSRINMVIDPAASEGPTITIRKQYFSNLPLERLFEFNMFDSKVFDYLIEIVEKKKNVLICGGTGTGKTTLMNALLSTISTDRIIVVEDTQEISLENEHTVYLKTSEHWDTKKNITMGQLVKNALRMRPDRLIVGEVRGGEAFDMIQAMNTGHSGSMSTGHSNSAMDMLFRVEMMILSNMHIPFDALRYQIASAIDCIIFIKRTNAERKVFEIIEINGCEKGEYMYETIYKMD